ncbi:MAG: Hsp20/alpha crystallin family protein [Candidatus Methanofastidiosia archaeon]
MKWYNPWEELMRLQEEIDGMFGEMRFPRRRKLLARGLSSDKEEIMPYTEPAADVIDKGKEFRVIIDLPGIDKKDISVKVKERSVDIKAEKKTETTEEQEGYFFQERRYHGYARTIMLPEDVIPNKTKADYNNGVLELTIEKAHPAKSEAFNIKFD